MELIRAFHLEVLPTQSSSVFIKILRVDFYLPFANKFGLWGSIASSFAYERGVLPYSS